MTTCLHDIVSQMTHQKFATQSGTQMHAKLAGVQISDRATTGDADLIAKIKSCPGATEYFGPNAMVEVPVAGTIDGHFISRRIDRMHINHATKQIDILDYKTDTDITIFRSKYIAQLNEYAKLLHVIYPDFKITAAILWTHEWRLEKILK